MKYSFSCLATAIFSIATFSQSLSFPARYFLDTFPYNVSTYNYHTHLRKDTIRNYDVDTSKPVCFDVLSKDSISFIPWQINNQSTNIRTTYSIDASTLNLIILIDSTMDTLYGYKCRNDSLIYCDYFWIYYVHLNKPYVGPPPYPPTMFVSINFPWLDSSNLFNSLISKGSSLFSDSIRTLDSIELRHSYYILKKSPIFLSSKNMENQKNHLPYNQPKLRFLNKGINLDCSYDLLGKKVYNKTGSIKLSIKIVIENYKR